MLADAGQAPTIVVLLDTHLPTRRRRTLYRRMLKQDDPAILLMVLNQMGLKRMIQQDGPVKLPAASADWDYGWTSRPRFRFPSAGYWSRASCVSTCNRPPRPTGPIWGRSLAPDRLKAQLHYRPRPYPHPVLLLSAHGKAAEGDVSAALKAWRKICPRIVVEQVPGSHLGMMRGENLKILAAKLGRHLAEASPG